MSNSGSGNDWPSWATVGLSACAILIMPAFGWIKRRLTGGVTRKEFAAYLEKRDEIADTRHRENLAKFDKVADAVSDMGQRLSHVEGAMSGSYRRPP